MNNERHKQIIDEAYADYSKAYEKDNSVGLALLVQRADGHAVYRKPDKEMFVTMCTYDKSFSEEWGLKIEERDLSFDERCKIQIDRLDGMYSSEKDLFIHSSIDEVKKMTMDKNEIPTKLITITYKDKTIESYE